MEFQTIRTRTSKHVIGSWMWWGFGLMLWFSQPFGAKRLPKFSCIRNYSQLGDVADVRGSNAREGEDGIGTSILSWMTFSSKFKGCSVPCDETATYCNISSQPYCWDYLKTASKKPNMLIDTCILKIVKTPNNFWFFQTEIQWFFWITGRPWGAEAGWKTAGGEVRFHHSAPSTPLRRLPCGVWAVELKT